MKRAPTKKQDAHSSPALPPCVLEYQFGPVEMAPIEAIKEYTRSPRKHSDAKITQLAANIRENGWVMPLLVDESYVIIAGHARFAAAKRLGAGRVPVLLATGWPPSKVRAYRLADNRLSENATWDIKLLKAELLDIIELDETPIEIMGWSTAQIDVITQDTVEDVESEQDAADVLPELPVQPVARSGDLWQLGAHRLLCASSLEQASWLRLMDGKTAAMVFGDGPYNVPIPSHVSGLGKVKHDNFAMGCGEMTSAQFVDSNADIFRQVMGVCKDGAVIMACMDHRHLKDLMNAGQAAGLQHLNMCIWKKTNAGMGSLWRSHYEVVLVLKTGTAPHTNNVNLGREGRYRTNIWEYAGANTFSATRMQDLQDHPTVKPVRLVADAIRDVTHHGEIVVDPFSGSGTTILACERTGRIGYAIEIDPKYIDVALRRWSEMTGGVPVLESTGQTLDEVRADRLVTEQSDDAPIDAAA